jgi:hypothetical protein
MRRIIVALIGAILAVAAAGCGPRLTSERPAIIVRGGSVVFESSMGWTRIGKSNHWFQNPHPGPPTASLRAERVGGTPCELPARPSFMQVRFREATGTEQTFNVRFARTHVMLQSPVPLELNGNVLTYPAEGEIVGVEDEFDPAQHCASESRAVFHIVPMR